MFAQLSTETARGQRRILAGSLVLHAAIFAWLLHTPEPRLLMPNSVALGSNGRVLTRIYWPSPSPDDSTSSSPQKASEVYRRQRLGHEKLTWKPGSTQAKLAAPQVSPPPPAAEDNSKTATLSNLGHGTTAGLPYGSLPGGPVYGDEIRPALPVATADPVVYPWELPPSGGIVKIEITIDERGEIVRKTILESLGPKIDEKVLEALNNWHFRPATQNGVAIPSKQDAIFHFHARG